MYKKILFIIIFSLFFYFLGFYFFIPIYQLNSVIIPYGLYSYDICIEQPEFWNYIKLFFIISYFFSILIISNFIFNYFNNLFSKYFFPNYFKNKKCKKINNNIINNNLNIYIGKNEESAKIFISEKGLFQNVLITGTIGSGKTSSAIYPIAKQLINYENNNLNKKIGMLILDVKGNFHNKILDFAQDSERLNDIIILEIGGHYSYNPLDKPNINPTILANRLKTILLLFSGNNSESYWLDKAEQILAESIKLCRLYNDNYVTFEEIHKLINIENYYYEKIKILKNKFLNNNFSNEDCYNLYTAIQFFEKEFFSLDSRTLCILKSEITRITNCFISDYNISKTFCPKKNNNNYINLSSIIQDGKIIILNINISEYKNLSKILAAYLKIDFQAEVLSRLPNNFNLSNRIVSFISDEYHEYITTTDADFFAQSREAKCINIVATQSYTSLLNTLNNQSAVKVIIQNLINKLWFRTDDTFTIEEVQKQIGKEHKEMISKNISESAKNTYFNYLTNSLNSKDSNITESINSYYQKDFVFDSNFFTQELETFQCLAFLSDGNKILLPQKLDMSPYFKKGDF